MGENQQIYDEIECLELILVLKSKIEVVKGFIYFLSSRIH